MKNVQIDKKVPIPPKQNRARYPFADMKKKDSFFIASKTATRREQQTISSAANLAAKRHGRKFTVRKVDGGFRVWRIE